MARKMVSCYRDPDCGNPRTSNAAHPKRIDKECQAFSLQKVQGDFGVRLRVAFDGVSNAEIARKLGLSGQSVVTKWMAGVLPTAEQFLKIYRITKTNLHWLLTGEGEQSTDPLRFLDDHTRAAIVTVASRLKIIPEALVSDLVDEALRRRAVLMIENKEELDGSQIDQLYAILGLMQSVSGAPSAEADSSQRVEKTSG